MKPDRTRKRHRGPRPSLGRPGPAPLGALPLVLVGALVGALAAAGKAGAETGKIYRCESPDGTLIFGDRPCDEQAEPIELGSGAAGGLSVIESPEDLAAVAEANARYLDQLRDDRAERLQAERDAQRTERLQHQAVPPMILPVPVYVDPRRALPPAAPAAPSDRMLRRQQAGERLPSATEERRALGSALSGRQLGARRRDDDG